MKVSLIQIGNSKGIRIPSSILKQFDFIENFDLILEKGKIILKPISNPREGWEEACRLMNENKDDKLLYDDNYELDNEDWNW